MSDFPLDRRRPDGLGSPRGLGVRPVEAFLARYTNANSRATMLASLRAALVVLKADGDVRAFPWEALRYDHVVALRAKIAETHKPATANLHLLAVRGVLREAKRLGFLTVEEFDAIAEIPAVRGTSKPAGRMLDTSEIHAVLDVCADGSARGLRDAAILALAAYSGLRRFEISGLDLADVDLKSGAIQVRGKGGKHRAVFVAIGVRSRLRAWIDVRGAAAGPLFCRGRRGHTLVRGERLGPVSIYNVVIERSRSVKLAHVTPHDFRRTFASTLIDKGVDLVTVRDLLGHEDVRTTAKYDRRGDERKKRAAEALADAFKKEE